MLCSFDIWLKYHIDPNFFTLLMLALVINLLISLFGSIFLYFVIIIGPWHYLKIICGRIWLAWKLVRHPRVLNVYDTTSKKYEKVGLVATELEKVWELPHELKNREVCLFYF